MARPTARSHCPDDGGASKGSTGAVACTLSPLHHCDVRLLSRLTINYLLAHSPTGRRRRRRLLRRPTSATRLARRRPLLSPPLSSMPQSSVANSSPSRSYDLISLLSTNHELMSLPSRASCRVSSPFKKIDLVFPVNARPRSQAHELTPFSPGPSQSTAQTIPRSRMSTASMPTSTSASYA